MHLGRTCLGAALSGAVVVVLCASAHAAVVPAPDTTADTAGITSGVTDVVGGVTDGATQAAPQVIPTPDPKEVVDKVVTTVKDVADEVLPSGGSGTENDGAGSATVSIGGRTDSSTTRSGGHSDSRSHRTASAHRHHRSSVSGSQALPAPARSSLVVRSAGPNEGRASLARRIGHQIGRAAKAIAFPALLALLVGAFLVLQDRIDRSDPKLATWQKENDNELVVFE